MSKVTKPVKQKPDLKVISKQLTNQTFYISIGFEKADAMGDLPVVLTNLKLDHR